MLEAARCDTMYLPSFISSPVVCAHAVSTDRLVQQKDEFGSSKGVVKPFVIDLESTNGTHVNGEAIPTSCYYELKASDVIKFGTSNREYVLLHDEVS